MSFSREIRSEKERTDQEYTDFALEAKKTCNVNNGQLFGKMLRHIPGCGEEVAQQLLIEFKTWRELRAKFPLHDDTTWLKKLKENSKNNRSISKKIIAQIRLFIM